MTDKHCAHRPAPVGGVITMVSFRLLNHEVPEFYQIERGCPAACVAPDEQIFSDLVQTAVKEKKSML